MSELLVDFITSLDGYAAADGWPGWWGLEGPEYFEWLGARPEAEYTVLMGATTYRQMSEHAAEGAARRAATLRRRGLCGRTPGRRRSRRGVAWTEAAVARYPLRERRQAQLMLALYRCARTPDALAAYQSYRRELADELGLDPSPALQQLERDILQRNRDLAVEGRETSNPRRRWRTRSPVPEEPTRLVGREEEALAHGAAAAAMPCGDPHRPGWCGQDPSR